MKRMFLFSLIVTCLLSSTAVHAQCLKAYLGQGNSGKCRPTVHNAPKGKVIATLPDVNDHFIEVMVKNGRNSYWQIDQGSCYDQDANRTIDLPAQAYIHCQYVYGCFESNGPITIRKNPSASAEVEQVVRPVKNNKKTTLMTPIATIRNGWIQVRSAGSQGYGWIEVKYYKSPW